jgi:hypothetical protein
MKKEVDEHQTDSPESTEERLRNTMRRNIKKSLEIGLSAAVAQALMFVLVEWPPTSSLAAFTYVAAPLLLGAIVFIFCFCLFTCKIANEEGKKFDYRSEGMSETVLTRRLEDEMNNTTDFRGYVVRTYDGSEESKEGLMVFRSLRLTPNNVALKVPEDIVSVLAKPELLVPYMLTSIRLDEHVRGIRHGSIMMFIVAVPLMIPSVVLLPILVGRDFLDAFFEFGVWIFMAWIVILSVWAAARILKYMREERSIDQRAKAEYSEFPTALHMLADSGFGPAYGHPPFKKRLQRLGFNEPEPAETGFNSRID